MKNKRFLLFLASILTISCSVDVNKTPVVSTSAKPSPSITPSITPSVLPSTNITPSPMVSNTPTPVPTDVKPSIFVPAETGTLNLNNAYLKSPSNAFLGDKNVDLKFRISLASLPAKDSIATLFDIYDENTVASKSHYSLSLDDKGNFKLDGNTKIGFFSNTFRYDIKPAQYYEISFKKVNNQIDVFIDDKNIFTTTLNSDDFEDYYGKRSINLAADMNGKNKISCKISYLKITDVLNYKFKGNLDDSDKYKLHAIVREGSYDIQYKDKPDVITPISTPTPTATPSVESSIIPSIERNPLDADNQKARINLNTYDPKNTEQYLDCVTKKEKEQDDIRKRTSNYLYVSSKDCYDPSGTFSTKWVDLGTKKESDTISDIRLITEVFRDLSTVTIAGSDSGQRVFVSDIGEKSYDGIDANYLANKVDYENKNKVFSDSKYSSRVISGHVYAIKTYQYGKEPRYAKFLVHDIVTNDYAPVKILSPLLNSSPRIESSGTISSSLDSNTSYEYSVSSYDGLGDTVPVYLGAIPASAQNLNSKVVMSFIVPYGAKGFTIYRKDTINGVARFYKIGPFVSKTDQTVVFEDFSNKGVQIDNIPASDNSYKYVFKPKLESKPISVDYSYTFYGSPVVITTVSK